MEFELAEQRAPSMSEDGIEIVLSVVMKKPGASNNEAEYIYGVYIYKPITAPEESESMRAGIIDKMLKLINIYYDEGYAQAFLVYDANHRKMVYET